MKARAIYCKDHEGSEKCAKPPWKRGKAKRRAGKDRPRTNGDRTKGPDEGRNEEAPAATPAEGASSSNEWQTEANMSHNRQGARKNGQQIGGSNLGKRVERATPPQPQQE